MLDDLVGTVLDGRYRIERLLGQGGAAVVYVGHDLRHDRPVAIKVLRAELLAADGGERFAREIRITARLNHPHIVGVLDSGVLPGAPGPPSGPSAPGGPSASGAPGPPAAPDAPGAPGVAWYAMPLVDGESLRDRLDRERVLPVEEAVRIAGEIADAMAFAHGQGVVHRDLKPDNVLLAGGHALVADFGIARALDVTAGRLTATGFSPGTPAYMSPEQAGGGGEVDARSDVYALGCILFEMVTGEAPFAGPTVQAVVAKHLGQPAPSARVTRATVPAALDACIARALAKDPADRFASAEDMARALRSSLAPGRERRRIGPALGATLGAVLIGVVAGGVFFLRPRAPAPDAPAGGTQAVRLAVLPFENQSPDAGDAYFAAGLTEEVTSSVGQLSGLTVLAPSSAAELAGPDGRERARAADVAYLLQGSVRKEGDRARIAVRLTDVETGDEVWNRGFDRQAGEVLSVEVDVAHAVAAGLQGQLPPGAESGLRPPPTQNPEAYGLFLQSLSMISNEQADQRVAVLERAVSLDPGFATGWAALSRALLTSAVWSRVPLGQIVDSARAAAGRALALDSGSADGWSALAMIRFRYDWDWNGALAAHANAVRLNPNNADVHHDYARTLRSLGRFGEARTEYQLAEELDPIARRATPSRGRAWYYARDYEKALEVYRTTPDGTPLFAAEALMQLGRFAEAHSALAAGADSTDWAGLPLWAYYWAVAGSRDRAVAVLRDLDAAAATRYVNPYLMALGWTGAGDRDAALRWLERGYQDRNAGMVDLMVEPRFDPIRDDPRFQSLLERMHFPPMPR